VSHRLIEALWKYEIIELMFLIFTLSSSPSELFESVVKDIVFDPVLELECLDRSVEVRIGIREEWGCWGPIGIHCFVLLENVFHALRHFKNPDEWYFLYNKLETKLRSHVVLFTPARN
jgi:hypothetical protein